MEISNFFMIILISLFFFVPNMEANKLETILFAMPPTYSHTIGAFEIAKYYKKEYPETIIDFFWHSKYFKDHNANFNFLKYKNEQIFDEIISKFASTSNWLDNKPNMSILFKGMKKIYENVVYDIDKALKDRKYDLIVTHLANLAAVDLGDKYDIPVIILYTPVVMGAGGIGEFPWLPTLTNPVSPKNALKLTSRIKYYYQKANLLLQFLPYANEMDEMRSKLNIPKRGLSFGIDNHLVLIYSTWGIEYPRPMNPLVQMVGTPFLENAIVLPENSKDPYILFLNSMKDKDYSVLVSFGSLIHLNQDIVESIVRGIIEEDQHAHVIIVDRSSEIYFSHPRVVIRSWVDQKAIISHPKTRYVVSHCGSKGFVESVLNEKPIIAIPFVGDQLLTAQRAYEKGVAVLLDKKKLSKEYMREIVKTLKSQEKYMKKSIKMLKKVMLLEDGRINTSKWMKTVLTMKGYNHLIPITKVPFWISQSYDIIGFLLFGITISCILCMIILYLLGYLCCTKFYKKENHKKNE